MISEGERWTTEILPGCPQRRKAQQRGKIWMTIEDLAGESGFCRTSARMDAGHCRFLSLLHESNKLLGCHMDHSRRVFAAIVLEPTDGTVEIRPGKDVGDAPVVGV